MYTIDASVWVNGFDQAVAVQSGTMLLTLDHEHLTRLVGIVTTRTPADALAELLPPE